MLYSTCAELHLGQMLAVPNFTLMDSMAAVKIMDARMDSGMELPVSELPESDRLENQTAEELTARFDPFRPLSVPDVIWIMDRLLACEAAWHQGCALSQTLYTCLYFHALKSLSPKNPRFQEQKAHQDAPNASGAETIAQGAVNGQPRPPQLVYKVLRAFVLATVKIIDIAWSELTSKQHLQDGEDFASDKNGLSLLETTDTGYISAEIDDALEWLQSQTDALQTEQIDSLKARLNFRKQMLYAVQLLQDPGEAAPIDVVMHAKFSRRNWTLLRPTNVASSTDHTTSIGNPIADRLSTEHPPAVPLQTPYRNAAPSMASIYAFDPAYNRRLAWCQALRPICLPAPDDTWQILDGILRELQDVVLLLQRPSFLSWKTFFTHRAISYQTTQTISATPYIRSLLQTTVCDRNMIACRLPLEWLAETFFQEVALIDPLLLRRASRIGRSQVEGGSQTMWNVPVPLGQRVHYFMQRVAGQLVQYLTTLSQNRSRCKRTLASRLYREWVHISEEANSLGHQLEACLMPGESYIPDSLFAASQHLTLEIMSQITFSGFELELYGLGTDRQIMWWLASRIQIEQHIVCADLRDELSKWLERCTPDQKPRKYSATILYLSRQIHLAKALEQLTISTIFLLRLSDVSRRQSCTWPLSPHNDASRLELAKAIFLRRIKWMGRAAPPGNGYNTTKEKEDPSETLWKEYVAFQSDLDAADDSNLSSAVRDRLDQAILHLECLTSSFASDSEKELGGQGFADFSASLLATAQHNRDALEFALTHKAELAAGNSNPSSPPTKVGQEHSEWTFVHPWIPKWTPLPENDYAFQL